MPEAGRRVVVLVEALLSAQREDGLSQALGLLLVAVALQASHEKPVYVYPHWFPSVPTENHSDQPRDPACVQDQYHKRVYAHAQDAAPGPEDEPVEVDGRE